MQSQRWIRFAAALAIVGIPMSVMAQSGPYPTQVQLSCQLDGNFAKLYFGVYNLAPGQLPVVSGGGVSAWWSQPSTGFTQYPACSNQIKNPSGGQTSCSFEPSGAPGQYDITVYHGGYTTLGGVTFLPSSASYYCVFPY